MMQNTEEQKGDLKLLNARKRKRKVTLPKAPGFLSKLYHILQDHRKSHIIKWNEDGKVFTIVDMERFCNEVLSDYFKHKNLQSFVRQLNMYGFHKLRNKGTLTSFTHPQFQRDDEASLVNITRNVHRTGANEDQQEHQTNKPESHDLEEENEVYRQKIEELRKKIAEEDIALAELAKNFVDRMKENDNLKNILNPSNSGPPTNNVTTQGINSEFEFLPLEAPGMMMASVGFPYEDFSQRRNPPPDERKKKFTENDF